MDGIESSNRLFGYAALLTSWLYDQVGSVLWPLSIAGIVAAILGFVWRARARRQLDELDRIGAARRRVRDVAPGLACVNGRWRALDDRRGLVEDDSGAALVVFAPGHAGVAPVDGADVVVVGLGGGLVDDPRGAGYRGDTRLPQLAVVDAGHFVRPAARGSDPIARAIVIARRTALLAGAAFAVGLGLAATSIVIALRALS